MHPTENHTAYEKPDKMSVIYRADADTEIGMGHVMRCLALAQASKRIGAAAFIMKSPEEKIEQRLKSEDLTIFKIDADRASNEDIAQTLKSIQNFNADWLVMDGYEFGSNYQRRIHDAGIRTLLIDDMGRMGPYWTNLILNQNPHASEALYGDRQPHTELLLGCRFALLRKEFTAWRNWQRKIPSIARRILVTLGGGDKDNITAKVIDALGQLNRQDIEATIITGQLNPHYQDLITRAGQSDLSMVVKSNITCMSDLIAQADLVISAGGSTCYELATMASPFVTIVLAENQVEIASQFARNGLSVNIGWHDSLSPRAITNLISELIENRQRRYEMSHKAKTLVDGQGAERVVQAMVNQRTRF